MLVTWRYRERPGSLIQSFDQRAWWVFFACFLFATLSFWDMRYLLFFFLTALFFVFTSRITWKESRRAWTFIGFFILFYTTLTFITGRGGVEVYQQETVIRTIQAPFSIFGWQPTLVITVERICFAISQFLRLFSISSMTILIPYSLNPAHYGVAFHGLGMPDKFAYAMDLTMRFIPTFGRDFQLTLDAQRARGYELEKLSGGLVQQVRKMAPLVVPVTIHALIGSEDIIDAMDLRAFGIGTRTWLEKLTYRLRDRILIPLGVIILVGSIILSLFGFGKFWVPPKFQERYAESNGLIYNFELSQGNNTLISPMAFSNFQDSTSTFINELESWIWKASTLPVTFHPQAGYLVTVTSYHYLLRLGIQPNSFAL